MILTVAAGTLTKCLTVKWPWYCALSTEPLQILMPSFLLPSSRTDPFYHECCVLLCCCCCCCCHCCCFCFCSPSVRRRRTVCQSTICEVPSLPCWVIRMGLRRLSAIPQWALSSLKWRTSPVHGTTGTILMWFCLGFLSSIISLPCSSFLLVDPIPFFCLFFCCGFFPFIYMFSRNPLPVFEITDMVGKSAKTQRSVSGSVNYNATSVCSSFFTPARFTPLHTGAYWSVHIISSFTSVCSIQGNAIQR